LPLRRIVEMSVTGLARADTADALGRTGGARNLRVSRESLWEGR